MKKELRVLGIVLLLAGMLTPFTNCASPDAGDSNKSSFGFCYTDCPDDGELKMDFSFVKSSSNHLIFEPQRYVEFGGKCSSGPYIQTFIVWDLYNQGNNTRVTSSIIGNFNKSSSGSYITDCVDGHFNIAIGTSSVALGGTEVRAKSHYYDPNSKKLILPKNASTEYYTFAEVTAN